MIHIDENLRIYMEREGGEWIDLSGLVTDVSIEQRERSVYSIDTMTGGRHVAVGKSGPLEVTFTILAEQAKGAPKMSSFLYRTVNHMPMPEVPDQYLLDELKRLAKQHGLAFNGPNLPQNRWMNEIYGGAREVNPKLVTDFVERNIHLFFELLLRDNKEARNLLLFLLQRTDIKEDIKLLEAPDD